MAQDLGYKLYICCGKTMRREVVCMLLMLMAASVGFGGRAARAQGISNKQYALIQYTFTLHPDIRNKIRPFEGLFPTPPSQYASLDPVYFRLKGLCFESLRQRLERECNMYILPLFTYGRRFTYDNEGYPSMPIERAQRRGSAKYYMSIDIAIQTSPESSMAVSGEKYRDSILSPREYLRPKVVVGVTIYPRLGIIPRAQYRTAVQWMTPIRMEPTMLDGIVNSKPRYDRTSLLEAINLGISAVIEEIK